MDALSAAGVPVYALRGAQGGWQLDEDWRTQVPGLDEAELRALLMAQPRIIGDPHLAAAAESAIGKLMAALPVALRERAAAIRQRLYIDTVGWRAGTEDLTMLPIVQDAVWSDRKLAFRYRQPGGERADRTVDPLGLVAKGSTWYLFAGTSHGFRTYRVSRIEAARVLDDPADRPARFDLAASWKSSTTEFQDRSRYHATLRLDPEAIEWVRKWRVASPAGDDPNTFRIEFGEEAEACFVVLGLASHVEVVEPASLRERVAREFEAAIRARQKPL
jgi:predicted DNA-binding transcriptional regulator YafY